MVDDIAVERVHSLRRCPVASRCADLSVASLAPHGKHDLLALHAPFPLADLALVLGFGRKRPLVVHWHADIGAHAAFKPHSVEPLMRRTLRRADAIIVSDAGRF